MDLKDILAKRNYSQPPEITAIKKYVAEHFNGREVGVTLTAHSIVITAKSAAFVGSLKNHSRQLQTAADTQKRISFRIG